MSSAAATDIVGICDLYEDLAKKSEADVKANGTLTATLQALADADLNVQRAARALRAHPNTLYARIAGTVEYSVKGADNKKTVSILQA